MDCHNWTDNSHHRTFCTQPNDYSLHANGCILPLQIYILHLWIALCKPSLSHHPNNTPSRVYEISDSAALTHNIHQLPICTWGGLGYEIQVPCGLHSLGSALVYTIRPILLHSTQKLFAYSVCQHPPSGENPF